ncbi:hypothetical protein WG66_002454 [Moniliophthora roreri]|nr:hypothetical protein WG66_002454 [Moniliophthora roreri]
MVRSNLTFRSTDPLIPTCWTSGIVTDAPAVISSRQSSYCNREQNHRPRKTLRKHDRGRREPAAKTREQDGARKRGDKREDVWMKGIDVLDGRGGHDTHDFPYFFSPHPDLAVCRHLFVAA